MTERLNAHTDGLERAAQLLRQGRLVAFPTETVYGLGADATNPQAVAKVYEAKGRPTFNPLIAHVADMDMARHEGLFDAEAEKLAAAFWPGPLTLVVPRAASGSVCALARAGLESVALRMPAHELAHELLMRVERPVAAPSANLSGHVSPTRAAHVLADLDGRIDAVIDGGATQVGLESTIVACLGGRAVLLRPGGIPIEALAETLGYQPDTPSSPAIDAPQAPGMLASHYAPKAQVRMNAEQIKPHEAALLFGEPMPGASQAKACFNLSESGDLVEAAARLFDALRALDASGAAAIAVAPIPEAGLGVAINDRLRRAAAPR
jgi:L-threonylcarbamoyladenylate synthase